MFTNIEKIITIRNLKPKKKEGFLKVISAFSFIGIMLGVAVLIIVMSVMNGFRSELTQKILGFNPHISIKPYSKKVDAQFIDKLQKEGYNIQEIDIDQNSTLAESAEIRGVPTTIIYENGSVMERVVGYEDYDRLKARFDIYKK